MRRRPPTGFSARSAFRLLRSAAIAIIFLTGDGPQAARAEAATFTVDPTQIFLTARAGSVLLTLRNESKEALRFQLSVFSWDQGASGEMKLEATDDIVFFPSVLTLQPGEARRVRVGSATVVTAREKTYRIFVEELPPLDPVSGGVRVLTKMGIPIFLRPAKETAAAALSGLEQHGGKFRFTLGNTGTVHFVPQTITVRSFAGATAKFERPLDAWYVLAGGRREFETSLVETECALVTSIGVDIDLGSGKLHEQLQTPGGVCPR